MATIVIPIYNNPDIEERCIYSVLWDKRPQDFVIVVDDGSSTTRTKEMVENLDLHYIRHDVNKGPHAAWNTGIKAALSDNVILLGSDTVCPSGVLKLLADCEDAEYDMVSLSESDDSLSNITLRNAAPITVRETQPITSATMIKRSAFDAIGLFDEQFFRTFGDTDWFERFCDAGLKSARLSTAIYHGGSVTRKRLGVDEDYQHDSADHTRFLVKWAQRPDVRGRHQKMDPERAKACKAFFWQRGEQ